MSGNKMTDVTDLKSLTALDMDSGYISQSITKESDELVPELDLPEYDKSSAILVPEVHLSDCVENKDQKSSVSDVLHGDSGFVTDEIGGLTEYVEDLKLVDKHETTGTGARPKITDLPLDILFQQDDDGDTQLHIAAVHGYEKPVSTLIRVCPNKELLNVCNDYGYTPLHLAVMSRNAVITRMLVLAGADIGIRDRNGDTPLHKATALSNVKCIQALLMPVKEHQRKISSVLNQKNYTGRACVHIAASLGHIESLQALLFYGADINAREHLGGWTALHIAASRGDSRMVSHLQRCGGLVPRTRDFSGRTPRRFALPPADKLFKRHDDSDSDSDPDDDMFDEEDTTFFAKFSNSGQPIVA